MVLILNKNTSRKEMERMLKKFSAKKKGIDTLKYCGIVALKGDPLLIQKRLRDEWK